MHDAALSEVRCARMLMFTVSDPSRGDVELEVHFDDEGLAFLTSILR
jgi:hypothetical protein